MVFGYNFGIEKWWMFGIPLSILCGFISFKLIESTKPKAFVSWSDIFKVKTVYIILLVSLLSSYAWHINGNNYWINNQNETIKITYEIIRNGSLKIAHQPIIKSEISIWSILNTKYRCCINRLFGKYVLYINSINPFR